MVYSPKFQAKILKPVISDQNGMCLGQSVDRSSKSDFVNRTGQQVALQLAHVHASLPTSLLRRATLRTLIVMMLRCVYNNLDVFVCSDICLGSRSPRASAALSF